MINTEKMIEFDKIKEMWLQQALTKAAKEEIRSMVPYLSEELLTAKQRETTEARILIEKGGMPPLVSLDGIEEIFLRAQKGDCLTIEQLEAVETSLTGVKRLKDYLQRCQQYELSLAYYEENLNCLGELSEAIYFHIRNGQVDDSASRLLHTLRGDIIKKEEKMKEKAESIMRSQKAYMSDSFWTLRSGRICVPVKKEYKHKVKGSVIDKSATGNTLFIEPEAAGAYYEELGLLRLSEENEVRRILYVLTDLAAQGSPVMMENIRMIEKLDFVFSKGKLSLLLDGVRPEINTERKIFLRGARNPLIEKKDCIPLEFELGEGIRGAVITGPNTGGKTVALKTVALNCMMAQMGLHVTCQEAGICMNSSYYCDIGDGQNLSENLSTFSAHITNVLDILKKADRESFILMDELGSGTDPAEGMGIAIAILEELRKSGALFLVTTHYPEVKQYAAKREDIVNARMAFDKESLRPLYQLVIGEAGESCAFFIAKRLGMPETMLETAARAAYEKADFLEETPKVPVRGLQGFRIAQEPSRLQRKNTTAKKKSRAGEAFSRGDSVMVYPEKKIGIVCQEANEKGVLQVQLPEKKIWINHKRLKLHVAAKELYPEDYDFSIIFDTVENRKLRHQMERKHMEGAALFTNGHGPV